MTYKIEVHADPAGSPLGDGSADYPTRSIDAALTIARTRRTSSAQPVIIWLHAGTFPLSHTIDLTEADSSLTFAAWRQPDGTADSVTLSGGAPLSDWHEDRVGDSPVWVTELPASSGRTLYVAGERIPRPRLPHNGYFRMASQPGLDMTADLNATLFQGSSRFTVPANDVSGITDPRGIEVVVPHFWIQERMPLTSVEDNGDDATKLLTSSYSSMLCLKDGDSERMARYYLDGVPQALGNHPGEWLADGEGVIATQNHPHGYGHAVAFYTPRTGESIEDFAAVIPLTGQLVRLHGNENGSAPLRDVHFDSVNFAYADWHTAPSATPPFQMREDPWLDPAKSYASDPQAASSVPGVIEFSFAQGCSLSHCGVTHVDGYGVRLSEGCRGITISDTKFCDLGAGAVSCGGSPSADDASFCSDNTISDCTISHGGRSYPHCVAILLRHCAHMHVIHNEVSDFYSSAIACGWRWDYGPSASTDNLIDGNHLHHLGGGQLDWFGAIYTLGVSPGTVVSNNLIHDVTAASFGGWGILADPATSHVRFEGNVIHDVSSECFHIKTGRGNIITNNLFAYGASGQFSQAIHENHPAAISVHNVFVGNDSPAYSGALGSADVDTFTVISDANILWDDTAKTHAIIAGNPDSDHSNQWATRGNDVHSARVDPQLRINADGSVDCDEQVLLQNGITPFFHGVQGPRTTPPISATSHTTIK